MDAAVAEKLAAADAGEGAPPPDAAAPAGDPSAAAQPAAPGVNPREWQDFARYLGDAAAAMLPPEMAQHWTPERLDNLGQALARCAQHYGWTIGGLVGHPLAQLAVAALPLAWPIAKPFVLPYLKPAAKAAPAAGPGGEPTPPAPPAGDRPQKVAPIG